MTKPLPRAILFACLAMLLWTIITATISIALVGLPGSRDAAAEFQRAATVKAASVDLYVGPIVLLVCGWLAARKFTGRLAIGAGVLVGLAFILIDLLIAILFGNTDRFDLSASALSFLLKAGGATLGGLIASRRGAPMIDEP